MGAIQESQIDLPSLVEKAIEELRIEIQSEDALDSQRMTEQKSSNKLYKLLCRYLVQNIYSGKLTDADVSG
ncbi:hypothetical protein KIN20_028357 [Parelaphostrongylus tenuis]|uniref:Uncharacterized protein n=1 Tax=Parelaphostrongylus tenuis TaxID=148309 RepID=A0AAD5WER7_PARTN|nr:hypothetical protein KIN20_028357 [Parelaphostrongylus tenuis]